MRIAVIGGGTAGFIAAAHVTRSLPEAELLHVFDSSIPTIGVGEGTTPRFPVWLEEVTGLGFSDLAERCGATLKNGTRFDGWGVHGSEFVNRFQPVPADRLPLRRHEGGPRDRRARSCAAHRRASG